MEIRLAAGISADRTLETQMLSRQKCEALANYYLGFNGWSGKVQYHRQEEGEEGKVIEELAIVGQVCDGFFFNDAMFSNS